MLNPSPLVILSKTKDLVSGSGQLVSASCFLINHFVAIGAYPAALAVFEAFT